MCGPEGALDDRAGTSDVEMRVRYLDPCTMKDSTAVCKAYSVPLLHAP